MGAGLATLIPVAAFLFVEFGAERVGVHIPLPDDYYEECQQEGCDSEEVSELYASYESECFEESCDLEEVREIAGRRGSINAMLRDFAGRGWRINPCDSVGPCAYSPGNNAASGDLAFAALSCNQEAINRFWDDFDFDKGDWDEGFGYDQPCNLSQPLARTFNALSLLSFFGRSMPAGSSNWLPWFYSFSSNAIDELDARCDTGRPDGCILAHTQWGPAIDNWTQLYWPFFYGVDVPSRAGTLVHEARHADGKGHDGGSGCPRTTSCDTQWSYNGANTYQVLYLWWLRAAGSGVTTPIRSLARTRANTILSTGFNSRPTRGQVLGAGTSNPSAPFVVP